MARLPLSQFRKIVREAVQTLPPEITAHLANITIDILDEPTLEQLHAAEFSDEEIALGDSLYGLFVPTPGVGTSDMDMLDTPNQIYIYKHPLEDDFPDPAELRVQIWKTIIHEIAHHFGFSETDLERFESNPNPFGTLPE